jgi:hypothetical protein
MEWENIRSSSNKQQKNTSEKS